MPKTGIRPYETKTRGRQWLAYYRRDGRQVNKRGFRTVRQAEQWRADAMINAASPSDSRITVGEWVTDWLERHRSRIRPSTYERYEVSVRLWILPHLGMFRLPTVTHRHIEAMHNAATKAGRSPKTLRLNHAPLRQSLEDAVRDGIIPSNPASLVRLPRAETKEINSLDQAEVIAFLRANQDNELYPIYHLALYSGLRLGEILALRVGRDIDLVAGTITVRETRTRGVTGPPKTKKSNRTVVLDAEAVQVLDNAVGDTPRGELAFPISSRAVTGSMTAACKRAGVKRVRFHDLRHTHISLLLASGANVLAVSSRVGHSSTAMTLDVYGHVMPGQDEELGRALGDVLRRHPTRMLSQPVFKTA